MKARAALLAACFVGVVACSESAEPGGSTAGGGTGAVAEGGSAGTEAAGNGGAPAGAAGSATSGQGGTGAGGSGMGGAASGAAGASAGSGASGAGMGGVAGGGATGAGAGGMAGGGSGGASGGGSGGGSTACTRELLSDTTDAYFTALAARDPSTLPLAAGVKFTENSEEVEIGTAGLWLTAGALVYKHTALDVMECMAATQAVVPDGTMDIPFALRLKLVGSEITEVETIAVRPGDYSLATSNTMALAASGNTVNWDDPVPAADRNTREDLIGWMDKYFRMFPAGVCATTGACRRIENGGGNFMCSAGGSCSANDPGPGDDELTPRLILADVETGLGVGFTMFQGNTDMHMFKMFGDQVHGVSAVLGQAGNSGW